MTPNKQKPLEKLELICILAAAMPGIMMLTNGRIRNQAQLIFRISLFVLGLLGYIAIKIYQRKKMRREQ